MNVGVVMANVPRLDWGGSGIIMWSLLQHLVQSGRRVTLYSLLYSYRDQDRPREKLDQVSAELGLEATVAFDVPRAPATGALGVRLARRLAPPTAGLFPELALGAQIAAEVDSRKHDALCVFDFAPGLVLRDRVSTPALLLYGDPAFMVQWVQWRARFAWHGAVRKTARALAGAPVQVPTILRTRNLSVSVARGYTAFGEFCAQHADWYGRAGVRDSVYYPPPIVDMSAGVAPPPHEPGRPPTLVMASSFDSTSGLQTYPMLADIVARLEQRLGPRGFEIHLIGRGALDPRLAQQYDRPSVRLRGFLTDVREELSAADVVVAPVPLKIGNRVRILTAMAFGKCVVAHEFTRLGNPDLRHGENCLLGRSADDLATQLERVIADPALRQRLGRGARETWERRFAPDVAGASIAATLERIGRRSRA